MHTSSTASDGVCGSKASEIMACRGQKKRKKVTQTRTHKERRETKKDSQKQKDEGAETGETEKIHHETNGWQ